MKKDTFTYTARSSDNPEKVATFTLHNGSVSLELGNALVEQVEQAFDAMLEGESKSNKFRAWMRPAATGSAQGMIKPVPINDFDAHAEDDSLQATAWVRAGGLRLAPVTLNWQHVDNPSGARAFAEEVKQRREAEEQSGRLPGIFDYWITWLVTAVLFIVLPVVFLRMRRPEQPQDG